MLKFTRALLRVRQEAASVPIPCDLSRLLIDPLPTDSLASATDSLSADSAIGQLRDQLGNNAALHELLAADSKWHEAVDQEVLGLPATSVVGANCLALMTRVDQLLLDMGDVQAETAWPLRHYAAGQMAVWYFG